MIYLDWAATAPPEAALLSQALESSMDSFGNPSSPHGAGSEAKALLSSARAELHSAIFPDGQAGAPLPGVISFTGSGTEADQIPLLSLLRVRSRGQSSGQQPHILVSAIEHAAIYEQARVLQGLGWEVGWLRPDSNGRIQASSLSSALKPTTRCLAVMALNNETGAIQDIDALASVLRRAEGGLYPRGKRPHFHVDCVQALGKIDLGFLKGNVESAAFSAHKLGGPKGVGALWTAKPLDVLAPGGGQEGGIRGGTENVFGAMAFGACARKSARRSVENKGRALELERRLLSGIASIPGALPLPLSRIPGDRRWCPNILSVAFPGLAGEVMVRALSDRGICISTGSACSHSGRLAKGRRILEAMGLPEELSFSSVRISTGSSTETRDIDAFLEAAADIYRRLA